MAIKIKHIDKLSTTKLQPYTLDSITLEGSDKPLVLILKHAGEGNDGYQNEKKKIDARLKAQSGSPTNRMIVTALIAAFAKHVVAGWENAVEDGKPATCTPAKVQELLNAIVIDGLDIVDRLMGYALEPSNFRDQPALDPGDLGKE